MAAVGRAEHLENVDEMAAEFAKPLAAINGPI
jgi:hypothetical protein